ncbi:MAG: hypothetical protein ABIP49_00780 [Lysobacterales bacterium]
MSDPVQYAVFLFASAIDELGAALEPYLQDGPGGRHMLCTEIDSAGALFEMKLNALSEQGVVRELELMVPVGMIKLVIAVQQDGRFGFARRPDRHTAPVPVIAITPPTTDGEAAPGSAAARSAEVDPTL